MGAFGINLKASANPLSPRAIKPPAMVFSSASAVVVKRSERSAMPSLKTGTRVTKNDTGGKRKGAGRPDLIAADADLQSFAQPDRAIDKSARSGAKLNGQQES